MNYSANSLCKYLWNEHHKFVFFVNCQYIVTFKNSATTNKNKKHYKQLQNRYMYIINQYTSTYINDFFNLKSDKGCFFKMLFFYSFDYKNRIIITTNDKQNMIIF